MLSKFNDIQIFVWGYIENPKLSFLYYATKRDSPLILRPFHSKFYYFLLINLIFLLICLQTNHESMQKHFNVCPYLISLDITNLCIDFRLIHLQIIPNLL